MPYGAARIEGRLSPGPPTVLRKSIKVTGDPAPKGLRVMTPDLSDDEKRALAELLTRTIENDRYPLSPRIQILKGILRKIRSLIVPLARATPRRC
jgi:hypothetical protein